MAQEQYVTFDTAKLLMRNGFAEECRRFYTNRGIQFELSGSSRPTDKKHICCPTQAVVQRWLREDYKIAVIPVPYRYPGKWKVIVVYLGEPVEKDDKYDICELGKEHLSYEDAAEYGIRHVVKNIVAKIRKALKEQND